jgi:hypothetical protein
VNSSAHAIGEWATGALHRAAIQEAEWRARVLWDRYQKLLAEQRKKAEDEKKKKEEEEEKKKCEKDPKSCKK